MVTLGTGRDDPRAWVRAAYLLADAAGQAAPGAKLPTQSELTTRLGISPDTATRACQELARLGIVHLVAGHGYYAGDSG
jgi:DNA-binding transcriptional regulator YhcF (GntR family)